MSDLANSVGHKVWKGWFAFALTALVMALSAIGPAPIALADKGGEAGHTFDATFTKWVVSPGTPPVLLNMAGVVGGEVGPGTYSGEVYSRVTDGNITNIVAIYRFDGSQHSFAALMRIREDATTGTAALAGEVIQGWHKGAPVTGEYTVYAACPIPTPGNIFGTLCFQGTLHIHVGHNARGDD
jgi:hypothetical protein